MERGLRSLLSCQFKWPSRIKEVTRPDSIVISLYRNVFLTYPFSGQYKYYTMGLCQKTAWFQWMWQIRIYSFFTWDAACLAWWAWSTATASSTCKWNNRFLLFSDTAPHHRVVDHTTKKNNTFHTTVTQNDRMTRYRQTPDGVDCVWNVMAHAQKPDFVFWWNGRVHLNRCLCVCVSSVDYWQPRCAHQWW